MDAEELAAWIKAEAEGRVEKAAGQPIAIVGGGPAGLAAAHDLALMGFSAGYLRSRTHSGRHAGFGSSRLPLAA